jgi:membrane-bound lytic murein transglycosylase D
LAPEVVLHRVAITARKGDTLASLGARHGVTAASLAGWNRLPATAALKSGQHLVVFVPSMPPARSSTRLAAHTRPASKSIAASKNKPARQVAQASRPQATRR